MLAQWHFRYAAEVYDRMQREREKAFIDLTERINLRPEERQLWQRAAENMYIPFNSELGIHEQDDSFLYLDPVDMSRIPRHIDLRNHTHPLNLWRMQVVKQADVVLLMFVLGDQFTREQKRANYEFYEPRTNHGSSLSTSIHSVAAAEIGKLDEAYAFFRHSAYMDLHDFKDNTAGGVHSACMGGTWMAVVNGFAGMRDYAGGLVFDPALPAAWSAYRFKLRFRGRLIDVRVQGNRATYRLLDGDALTFRAAGEEVEISAATPTTTSTVRRAPSSE
jgi:alpha,alpha-trehalose phosphorylase